MKFVTNALWTDAKTLSKEYPSGEDSFDLFTVTLIEDRTV